MRFSLVMQKTILLLAAALLLQPVIFLCMDTGEKELVSFQVSSGETAQMIKLWKKESGQYYVFLPSYANLDDVKVVLHSASPVSIHGITLENGMYCTAFAEGISYPFVYTARGRPRQGELVFLRSSNVATMYIKTQTGGMDYIHAKKGNEESGTLTLYASDGTIGYSGNLLSVQGRGNSSWTAYEKKPYSIQLEEEANLLTMGKAQKWILLANAGDPSHMRNKVIYDFADRIGMQYAPDSAWVDLYLNGEYAGLYLLCERNEVHPERVNIERNNSFLVSLEYPPRLILQNDPHFQTGCSQYLRVHYPEEPTPLQLQALKDVWQSVENAILSENDVDPVTGKHWMELIDLDSWVKKYLLEEIFGNYDACFISQFFYKDGSDTERRIYAGPVWDYDNTMGSKLGWQLKVPNTLFANRYCVVEGFDTPWFYTLYQKEAFYESVVETYQNDFLPVLNTFLCAYIADCSEHIAEASVLNRVRWNLGETDISEEAEYLQSFMGERIAFLNRIWIDEAPYCTVKADNAMGNYYGYFVAFPGDDQIGLPVFEDTRTRKFIGWFDSDTGEPFTSDEPIHVDVTIHAKWQSKPVSWIRSAVKGMPLVVLGILLLVLACVDFKRIKMDISRK